jgi:hypothetical protein
MAVCMTYQQSPMTCVTELVLYSKQEHCNMVKCQHPRCRICPNRTNKLLFSSEVLKEPNATINTQRSCATLRDFHTPTEKECVSACSQEESSCCMSRTSSIPCTESWWIILHTARTCHYHTFRQWEGHFNAVVIAAAQQVLCRENPLAVVAMECVSQCPWAQFLMASTSSARTIPEEVSLQNSYLRRGADKSLVFLIS